MSTQFDELEALAQTDPAPAPNPRAHTAAQAQQLLTRIIGSPAPAAGVDSPTPPRRRRKA